MVPRPLEICTGRCARPQPLQQGTFDFAVDGLPKCSILHRLAFPVWHTVRAGWIELPSHKTTERREGGIMKTQADYRKLAEDCVRLAQTAKETHRAMLLNMANTWLQFADQVARDQQWMANGRGRAQRQASLR